MHARKLPSWRPPRERKADQAASRNGDGDKKSVTKSEERIQSSFDRPLFLLCPLAHGTDGGQDHEVRTRKGEGVGRTADRRPLLDREQSTSSAVAIFRRR